MKTYKSASEVKKALLNLEEVVIGKWSAKINSDDELEMYAPDGSGRAASFHHFDKAVEDFYKWAGGMPETDKKPKSYPATPSGSGPLGPDTSDKKPWPDPKVNTQPVMQGDGADTKLGPDTTQNKPWVDPTVVKNPEKKEKENGTSDPTLGPDTSRNPTHWDSSDDTNNAIHVPSEDNISEEQFEPSVETEPHQIKNTGENVPSLGEFHANRIIDSFIETKREASYQELVQASPSAELLKDIANPNKWATNQALRDLGYLDKPELTEMGDPRDAGCDNGGAVGGQWEYDDRDKNAEEAWPGAGGAAGLLEPEDNDKNAEGGGAGGAGGVGMGEGVSLPAGGSVTHPKKKELTKPQDAGWPKAKASIVDLAYALAKAGCVLDHACKIMANPANVEKFAKLDKTAQLDPSAMFPGDLPQEGGEALNPAEFGDTAQLGPRADALYNEFLEMSPFMGDPEQVQGLESIFEGIRHSLSGGDTASAESMLAQIEDYMATLQRTGTKIRENWGQDGQYQRDLEAESAEELYHLTRSLGQDDPYDWATSGQPRQPGEEVPMDDPNMMVQAVDDSAKAYWSDYLKDYGKDLTKGESGNKNRKDNWKPKVDETPESDVDTSDTKKAQMDNAPGGAELSDDNSMVPDGGSSDPTAPVMPPKPAGPPGGPGAAPPAGPDAELKQLGWSDQDLSTMSNEDKQNIVNIKLKKPGSGAGLPGKAPADKTPAPAPPGPPPADGGGPPGMGDPQGGPAPLPMDNKAPVASREAQMAAPAEPAAAPAAPPAAPEAAPAAPAAPQQGGEQFAGEAGGDFSPESEALKVYNQIMEQEVKASTADQVPAIKAQMLVQRLLSEVGMPINEARNLFGLTKDKGFNTLFK